MLKIGKNISEFSSYTCQPKSNLELKGIIEDRVSKYGTNCDLNDIDVSLVTNMSYLFYGSKFNGDISGWYTSKVLYIAYMFAQCDFNGDISNWDVSKVKDISGVFYK